MWRNCKFSGEIKRESTIVKRDILLLHERSCERQHWGQKLGQSASNEPNAQHASLVVLDQ